MWKIAKHMSALAACLFCSLAWAADAPSVNTVMDNFRNAGLSINSQLVKPAISTAAIALSLQWIISHWKDIFNSDLSNTIAKTVGMMSWFGLTVALIQHQDLLTKIFDGYVSLSGQLAGISGNDFTPWAVINEGRQVMDATHEAVGKMAGNSAYAIGENVLAAGTLLVVDMILMICFFVIALSLFVTTIEFYMMFSIAPLAFGLIPLAAFRDQGMAPIKGVISIGLRLLILAVVVAVAKQLSGALIASLADGISGTGSIMSRCMEYHAGIGGCAVMAFSAGKLAAAIASGSASFSGSDAMRAGMQLGTTAAVGVGAAAAVGVGAAAATGKASSALPGLGKAAGQATGALMKMGGAQASSPGGFGGSPVQQRPSAENTARANAATSQPAGIGGSENAQSAGSKSGPSAMQRLGDSAGKAVEQQSHDQQAVSVSLNTYSSD